MSKSSDLAEEMVEFNSIYSFKSDNENINLVVNHEDFFFKLLETSLNLNRLSLSMENQIFVLEQIYMTVRKKLKSSKESSEEVESYAVRLL
jgi:hypothetical protein